MERRSFKLKKKRVQNDPGMWIRAQDAFAAVIERELFEAARTIIGARSFRLSDEMLQSLRALYQQRVCSPASSSTNAMGCHPAAPTAPALAACFAPTLVGFTPDRDYRYVEINRELRKLHPGILVRCSTDCGQRAATPGRISRPTG
jgi:hypothetical protein